MSTPHDPILPNLAPHIAAKTETPSVSMVTRVPVFENDRRVWGYDLLLSDHESAAGEGASTATSDAQAAALSNAFALLLPFMGKDEKLVLPFNEDLLLNNTAGMFPAAICAINLFGPIKNAAAVRAALSELKENGYFIEISCSRSTPDLAQFLPLAKIARVDIQEFEPDELKLTVNYLKGQNIELLAENVTPKNIALCSELGFKYLQGDIHTHKALPAGKNFSSSQVIKTKLLKTISEPEWELRQVAELIRIDVSLSYRLLRYLNSAYFSLPGAITSIESSVVLLGQLGLKQWIYLTIFSDFGVGPLAKHIISTAAFRGKFLELLAGDSAQETPPQETLFMLGLFSMLEALLNMPLEEIGHEIKIDEEIIRTLQGKDTKYQPWFSLLLNYERGQWDSLRAQAADLGLALHDISSAYAKAMAWVAGLFGK